MLAETLSKRSLATLAALLRSQRRDLEHLLTAAVLSDANIEELAHQVEISMNHVDPLQDEEGEPTADYVNLDDLLGELIQLSNGSGRAAT